MSDAIENPSILASWWRRMAYTPLRDWTRGRLTARLDLKALVARCELPPELRDVVYKTARGARLWRLERVDAAQELIDHFTDGLQAGQTPAQLRESFGDWKVAARLIGRAKRRTRPLWLRIAWGITKTAAVLLAVFAILSALLVIRYRTVRPIGDTSFTDALNEKARNVPEADRAWPLYKAAIEKLTAVPLDAERKEEEIWLFNGIIGNAGPADVARYVDKRQDVVELVRQGAAKARSGFYYEKGLSGLNNPSWEFISRIRQLSQLLMLDLSAAADQRDGQRILKDVQASVELANHAIDGFPFDTAIMIRVDILRQLLIATGAVLANNTAALTEQQFRELSNIIGSIGDEHLVVDTSIELRLSQERMTYLHAADGFLTPDGVEDAHDFKLRKTGIAGLRESKRWFDRAIAEVIEAWLAVSVAPMGSVLDFEESAFRQWRESCKVVPWERKSQPNIRLTGWAAWRYSAANWPLWKLDSLDNQRQAILQQRDAVLTAIALELYHRNHGDWPKTLDALVPEFLTEIPVDRFDGKPLKYVLRDGRPELYSVGIDRNDDGGVAPENEDARKYGVHTWRPPDDVKEYLAKDPTRGGDWILWPTPEPRKTTDDAARD